MTKSVYKTAQGKLLDMGKIMLQNEKTRAVGNMGVNARGDVVDGNNNVISPRNEQVSRQYNQQTTPKK